jgi:hypothetical protein
LFSVSRSKKTGRPTMPGYGYASREEAIRAAQDAMRATFGAEVRFEQFPAPFDDRSFRVLDSKGRHLDSFGTFQGDDGRWAWTEGSPLS